MDDDMLEFRVGSGSMPAKIIEHKDGKPDELAVNPSGHARNPRGALYQTETGELKRDKPEPAQEHEEIPWQDMETVGSSEQYDEKTNKLLVQVEHDTSTHDLNNAAAQGYTRVYVDDDAKSITSLDERTDHLFDESEDSQQQMMATKEMLDEEQRLAYVGLCRVVSAKMLTLMRVYSPNQATIDSFMLWERDVMRTIYAHMDISAQEQVMIEQLPVHGVVPSDLCGCLTRQSRAHMHAKDLHATEATTINSHTIDVRWTVLCDLFLNLLINGTYDSRSRTLLIRVGQELAVSPIEMSQFERKVTDAMQIDEGQQQDWKEEEIIEKRRKRNLRKKYAYIGAATLGGGLVIGLSAGLLAPVIGAGLAAGFTTIGIGGTGSFLAGAGGAALVTSTGVAVGARVGGKGMTKRMGHVKTFEFRAVHNNNRVNAIITISGWMNGKEDDVRLPFSTIDPLMGDLLSVYWEPEMMQSTGQTINILATEALTQSLQQILGATILTGLMASIQLPMALAKLSYLLDNPWNVSLDRAMSAGQILADTLIARNLGNRPVTLVGFSLGARVIYSCLVELAKRNASGLVQDVFIFGSPVSFNKKEFCAARSMVSGRLVSGYSRKDWVLGYLFRATSGGFSQILGLAPVKLDGKEENPDVIENVDVTDMVEGHMGYRKAMPKLLAHCGWQVLSEEFEEIEDPDPGRLREKQRKLIHELNDEASKTKKKNRFSFFGFGGSKSNKEWIDAAKQTDEKEGSPDSEYNLDAIAKEVARLEHMGPEMIFDVEEEEKKNAEKEQDRKESVQWQPPPDDLEMPAPRKAPGFPEAPPPVIVPPSSSGTRTPSPVQTPTRPYSSQPISRASPKPESRPESRASEPKITMSFDFDDA